MVLVPVSSLLALTTLALAYPRPHGSSSSSLSSRHAPPNNEKPITIPLPAKAKRSAQPNKNSTASDTKRRAGHPYSNPDGSSQAMLAGRGEDDARRAQTHDTPLIKASKSKDEPLQDVGTKHASNHNKRVNTGSCGHLGTLDWGYLKIVTPTTVQPEAPAPLANLVFSWPADRSVPPSFLLNAENASYALLIMITEGPPDPAANGTVPVMIGFPSGSDCMCMSANLGDTDDQHLPLSFGPCDPEDASQQFAFDPDMSFVSPLMVDTPAAAAASGSGNATTTATAQQTTGAVRAQATKRGLEGAAGDARDAASTSMDATTETVTTTDALPTTLLQNEVDGLAVNTMYTSEFTLTTSASTTATTATASTTVTNDMPLPTPPRPCNGKEGECSGEDDEGEYTYDPCAGEGEECGKATSLGTRKVVGTPVEPEPYRYVFAPYDGSPLYHNNRPRL